MLRGNHVNWCPPIRVLLGPAHTYSDIFWIRNFFFPDWKISNAASIVFNSNSLFHIHPMASGFTPEKLGYTLCRHIGLLFGKRLDTILLRYRIRKCTDSLSTRYWILYGFFFHSGQRIKKYPESLPTFTGWVCTEALSEKKKLPIQKYRDVVNGALEIRESDWSLSFSISDRQRELVLLQK